MPGSVGDRVASAATSPPMVATAGCRGAGAAAVAAATTDVTASASDASSGPVARVTMCCPRLVHVKLHGLKAAARDGAVACRVEPALLRRRVPC